MLYNMYRVHRGSPNPIDTRDYVWHVYITHAILKVDWFLNVYSKLQ